MHPVCAHWPVRIGGVEDYTDPGQVEVGAGPALSPFQSIRSMVSRPVPSSYCIGLLGNSGFTEQRETGAPDVWAWVGG